MDKQAAPERTRMSRLRLAVDEQHTEVEHVGNGFIILPVDRTYKCHRCGKRVGVLEPVPQRFRKDGTKWLTKRERTKSKRRRLRRPYAVDVACADANSYITQRGRNHKCRPLE